MAAQPHPRISVDDYLADERRADHKSEYYDGSAYAMAGGTPGHGLIAANAISEFKNALRGRGCRVYTSDVLVRSTVTTYTYPDVSIVCGTPKHENNALLNPIVIIEVLSPSTELLDRGVKFARYRQIESLQEYVLISSTEPLIEIFHRGADGSWNLRDASGMDASCRIESLDCSVPLAGIYDQVEFPPREQAIGSPVL
jgi:Uma2 family endonuclease